MATTKPYQLRKGTTTQRIAETLASGYAVWDETTKTLYVHDGTTAGGVMAIPENRIVPASGTAGYLLSKDANGNNVWVAPPSAVDCRTFALMTGVEPFKWYYPTAKTALSAVVEPSKATTDTMTIYIYSKVVGSSTTNTVATLSIPAVAAKIPTTVDFTDATIPANSQIWAECADLKSGGSVSVSVVMQ